MEPIDQELYNKIKNEIYKLYPVHSLFRSALLVKEYKKRGGKYYPEKEKVSKPKMNIKTWFKQNWLSVNDYYHNKKKVPCGSSDTQTKFNEYPLCRPEAIIKKLTNIQMKKLINQKNKLKEKQLITEDVLSTKKFNIKNTKSGI
jgi:hypothetical protein